MRIAIVSKQNNKVLNVSEGVDLPENTDDLSFVASNTADIGDTLQDGNFIKPSPKEARSVQDKASRALPETDMVALRCFKAGVPFPTDWKDYVTALRAVASGNGDTLPKPPMSGNNIAYPQGT